MIIRLQKIFYSALLSASCSFGQILISGTSFDPKVEGDTARAFWSASDIKYTGIAPGTLAIYPPLAPSANTNIFDGSFYYGITNNPAKLDAVRYQNVPAGSRDNQLVVSPYRGTGFVNILSYKVAGLAPGSNVEVRMTYCSAVSASNTFCTAQVSSFRGIINPDQYNTKNGLEGPQVQASQCTDFTVSQSAPMSGAIGANGELTFYLNESITGDCKAMALKSIEIWGTPKPVVSVAEGAAVCATETIHLSTTVAYQGSYKWEVFANNAWTIVGKSRDIVYTPQISGNLQFRVSLTPDGSTTSYVSSPATVIVSNCCGNEVGASTLKTIYLDDFGTLDLSDPTGRTYQVLDYISTPKQPNLVKKTTTTPFRWPLGTPPFGAVFKGTDVIMDGEYTVASYITSYQPYNGIAGAMLNWSGCINGLLVCPTSITFDHSGRAEGAALFLNFPPNAQGQVFYAKQLDAGCEGLNINAEAWISVFTNAATGPYIPVKVRLRLTDVDDPSNISEMVASATRQVDGGGAWVRVSSNLALKGSSYKLELINDQAQAMNGNDLVIDDIRVRACVPTNSPCAVVTNEADKSFTSSLYLYPNPTEGIVYLSDYNQYTSYRILDAQGQVLKTATVHTEKIDVSDLKQGVYTILLSSENTQVLKRIVKQ